MHRSFRCRRGCSARGQWRFIFCSGRTMGVAACRVTRIVYAHRGCLRDAADPLDVVAGDRRRQQSEIVGLFRAANAGRRILRTLRDSGNRLTVGIAFLCVMKFISWSIALGSGTSRRHDWRRCSRSAAWDSLLGGRAIGVGRSGSSGSICVSRRWWAWRRCSRARRGPCWLRACLLSKPTLQPLGLLPLLGGVRRLSLAEPADRKIRS